MKRNINYFVMAWIMLLCETTYGSSVDWLLSSHAGYRADGSVLDFGLEKVPGAAVQLQTGRLVFDTPEVSLKGSRGLDLVISRSHGKVGAGYHSLASWDLESPRLVLTTAPSTKLRGDAMSDGICSHTGDVSNGASGADYTYTASAGGAYAAELSKNITNTFISDVNRVFAQKVLQSVVIAATYGVPHNKASSNGSDAYYGNQALVSNIYSSLTNYTNSIITNNNWSEVSSLKSDTAASISNVFSGGNRVKIRNKNNTYTSFVFASNLTSVLNQDFFLNYDVAADDSVLVTNSSGVTTPYPHTMVRQLVLMYVYLNTLQSVKNNSSSWVTTQTTSANAYYFENKVDPRKRPVALYLPAQGNRLFYPVATGVTVTGFPVGARYVSQDNWFISCGVGSAKGMTVHSPNGVRYYFPETNRENQTGYPSAYKSQSFPGRVTLFASAVENVNRESYEFEYENIALGSQPFVGYNTANKLLLKGVKHKLDGALTDDGSQLLTFVYNKFNAGVYSNTYTSGSGDIVLRKIQRKRGVSYVDWVTYAYASGQKLTSSAYNSTADEISLKTIQDMESSKIYLDSATYINKDVYKYSYGGPYNISGNFPAVSGDALSSPQGFLWFFSDLTGVTYSRVKTDSTLAAGYTATWTYNDVAFNTPGYDETKSYRVGKSTYVVNGAPVNYVVNYTYTAPANNEQVVTVSLPLGKTHAYTFNYYPKGLNESPLQGYLKSISLGHKTTSYAWVPSIVIGQKPIADGAYDDASMENVNRYRQGSVVSTHHGSYGRSLLTFDAYDNPTSVTEFGLNGSSPISRALSLSYFNSDPLQIIDGGDNWWILGLKKTVSSGVKSLWAADYDDQGALTYKIVKGVRTDYEYTETSFSSCLPSLTSFEWGNFVSCVANVVFGDYHSGLVYKEDVGQGELVTKFAAYEKGIPQRVRLSNGGEEINVVDDYGNIVRHSNPLSIESSTEYNDAGEVVKKTPVAGLAYYTIGRNGFVVTTTLLDGAAVSTTTTESLDGFGRLLTTNSNSGGRTIYKKYELDVLGRIKKDGFPADSSASLDGVSYTYDEFDRVLTESNGTAVYTYCYQSCGSDVGSIVKVTNSLNDQTVVSSYYALAAFSTEYQSRIDQRGVDGSSLVTEVAYDPNWLLPTSSSRGRSSQIYAYDVSGQLDSITDNVSGVTGFTYDSAGRPGTITLADGIVETRQYYGLGDLVLSRSLSGGNGAILYDYTAAGALKKASSAHAVLDIGYDNYGRPWRLTQTVSLPNQANRVYTVDYGYNNFGQITSLTYPGGKAVDLSNQNGFGHVVNIPGVAESLAYDAYGNLKTLQMGSLSWDRSYATDGRLQGINFSTSVGCNYKVTYGYDLLNRINKVTDNCNRNDNIDSIDRWGTGQIKAISGGIALQAMGNAGTYSYTYDQDDIASVTRTVGIASPQVMTYQYKNSGSSPLLNNVTGTAYTMSYDDVGRITSDGGRIFTYDGFGRMLSQTDAQSSSLFYYAADSLRVSTQATTGGVTENTDYVYGLSGELLYEVNMTSQLAKSYIYVAGQLLATFETYPDTDSDQDGMVDEEEIENGLNPLLASDVAYDADADGLPDWQERLWGLDSNNPDTDGDGDSDGYEYERLGLLAAFDSTIRSAQSETAHDKCIRTKCWLIPVTLLLL